MAQDNANQADATIAPEIEALLSMSSALSIFDRLMAMPRADSDAAGEWDRAVATRLQSKVAGLMKARLAGDDTRRAA